MPCRPSHHGHEGQASDSSDLLREALVDDLRRLDTERKRLAAQRHRDVVEVAGLGLLLHCSVGSEMSCRTVTAAKRTWRMAGASR
jgi:Arc/MetJ-type ribon-helix-helix transcriptional regulator